jgi:hypothetical protein
MRLTLYYLSEFIVIFVIVVVVIVVIVMVFGDAQKHRCNVIPTREYSVLPPFGRSTRLLDTNGSD